MLKKILFQNCGLHHDLSDNCAAMLLQNLIQPLIPNCDIITNIHLCAPRFPYYYQIRCSIFIIIIFFHVHKSGRTSPRGIGNIIYFNLPESQQKRNNKGDRLK